MQIKAYKSGSLVLKSSAADVLFTFQEEAPAKADEFTRVIGFAQNDPLVISEPGEYEYVDYGLVAMEKREQPENAANIFNIEIDGVNVLCWGEVNQELTKEEWQTLGNVDIFIFSTDFTYSNLDKVIKKANAQKVIAFGRREKSEIEKVTNMSLQEIEGRFKYSAKDFQTEDAAVDLYQLS